MCEKIERWRKIDNADYWVSNQGRIRSRNHIIKPQLNKRVGLLQAMIYVHMEDGSKKMKLLNVSNTVGKYWLPKPKYENMVVRHINTDRLDNRVENLVWGFPGMKKNKEHGISLDGKIFKKSPRRTWLYRYVIKQITQKGLVIGTYNGFEELERMGYKRAQIMLYSKGKYPTKLYKGFQWTVNKLREKIEG